MFGAIADKFIRLRRTLAGYGRLSPREIDAALKDIRFLLLEADVNYQVVKDFCRGLEGLLKSETILASLKPADQVTRIVYQELVRLLGGEPAPVEWHRSPSVIMIVGLQGVGKTTTAAKLGHRFRARRPMFVAADPKRPAAAEQLRRLAERARIDFFDTVGGDAVQTCAGALEQARLKGNGLVIFDTAGRLHIDEELTRELAAIKERFRPDDSLLVVDGMTGQDAVRQAKDFNDRVGVSGAVLTKLDGDERGGAALSVRSVTGVPVRFIATGEHLDDLEEFVPERVAARIMGIADVRTLAEKVEQVVSKAEGERLAKKAVRGEMTFDDLLGQMRALGRMGGLSKLTDLVPGLAGQAPDAGELRRTEAIILSMTAAERARPEIINGSRRRRIADGSGTTIQMVNQLLNQFRQLQDLTRRMGKGTAARGR